MTLGKVESFINRKEQAMSYLLHRVKMQMAADGAFAKLSALEKELIKDKTIAGERCKIKTNAATFEYLNSIA